MPGKQSRRNDSDEEAILRAVKQEQKRAFSRLHIENLEKLKAQAEQDLIQASMDGNAQAIAELPKKNRDLAQQLEFLYGKLELATREFEKKSEEFNTKLKRLED